MSSNEMPSRLYRDPEKGVWLGVFAGLAEYVDADPVILRLIFVFITLGTGLGFGLIAYLISAFVIPNKDDL